MKTLAPSHITIDENGVARIDGTRMKVIHIVGAWKSGADSPEKIYHSYPHLTRGQIYSALSYYFDHQREIDEEMERSHKEYEAIRAAAPDTPLRKKLRDRGLRP